MFKADLIRTIQEETGPLGSGVTFGKFGHSILFHITDQVSGDRLQFNFTVQKNKDKKDFELQMLPIHDDQLEIFFFNPARTGPSGLLQPLPLAQIDLPGRDDKLSFMFWVDCLSDSEFFRLSYEFYQGVPQSDGSAQ